MKRQIISIKDIKPSQNCLRVLGVFNPGATIYNGKTVLLLRVAEVYNATDKDKIIIPIMENDKLTFKEFDTKNTSYDFSDSRVIKCIDNSDRNYLTSLSHFRIAISEDGIHFDIANTPTIMPSGIYEEYGIEDPRINIVDGKYLITYTAVSRYGIVTGLIETNDFINFERKGYIFHPDNKDVVLFPKKIDGLYYALHRPSSSEFGDLSIWLSSSNDLLRFGNHIHLLSPFNGTNRFDNYRIGGGCPLIEIDEGYLEIYHGANKINQYKIGAFIIDKNNLNKIIKICKNPILEPTLDFEKNGFIKDVVFTCGAILKEDKIIIYYGAGDDSIGVEELSLKSIIENMEDFNQ